ncbi:sensor histidine kinase [Flavobacterium sp.]|uniref:sensor histidine kinase n=1 Tax=Flavobacterium sp. TaxID=239 RepID=UPI00375184AD
MNFIIRFIIAFLLLLLFGCTNSSNTLESQPINDFIKKYLELASNDTISLKTRKNYDNKLFSLILKMNNSVEKRKLCKSYLSSCFILKDWYKYKIVTRILYQDSKNSKDTYFLAFSQRSTGNYFYQNQILDSAYYYYLKAEKNYLKVNDKRDYAIISLKKAIIQYSINDYIGSELSLNKSYIILSKLDDFSRICDVLNQQGLVNIELKNYELAEKKYFDALKIINKNKENFYIKHYNLYELCLGNLALLYCKKKDYKNSSIYCEKTLLNKDLKLIDPELYSNTIEILAWSKMKLNDNQDLTKLFFESLRIRKKLNISYRISDSYFDISEYYLYKKDSTLAKQYAEKALFFGNKSKVSSSILNGLRQVGYTDESKAQQCIDKYDKKIDSLLSAERKTRNQFYKIQLDTNEITQEKETAIQQKWTAIAIIAAVLLIVILLFIIFKQKAKQKEFKFLQDQQKSNEEIYQLMLNQHSKEDEARQYEKKRIALELHDNIMNKLAATRFNLFAISQKTDKETIDNAVVHIAKIKGIEDEIRSITHSLSKESLEETYSFKTLIEKLIEEQNTIQSTNYKLEIENDINWETIASKIKMNLYRILQEAIHNINKHADATNASINIILDERNICMAVQDNGKGFDESYVQDGIGLKNMRQRIIEVKGKITIHPVLNKGTSIFFAFPF